MFTGKHWDVSSKALAFTIKQLGEQTFGEIQTMINTVFFSTLEYFCAPNSQRRAVRRKFDSILEWKVNLLSDLLSLICQVLVYYHLILSPTDSQPC